MTKYYYARLRGTRTNRYFLAVVVVFSVVNIGRSYAHVYFLRKQVVLVVLIFSAVYFNMYTRVGVKHFASSTGETVLFGIRTHHARASEE